MTTLDPVAAAEQWLAPVKLETTAIIFVIGFGDGHVLEALGRRGWSGHVVALEPDAATAADCPSRKPVREWQMAGRLTILAGPDYTGLAKVLATLTLDTEKPVMAGNPEAVRAHREACVHAVRTVTRAWFGARANDEARRKNAGRYLQNTLRNAAAILREDDAAVLKDLFTGVPALVVGAGPSLDRNVADIVRYRDRVIIIAADTSLRPLLAAGVEPDVVIATDPTETNARHLNDLPSCERTYLAAEGSVDPESLPHFEGRTFFFRIGDHHPWPWLRQQGHDRVHLRAWGSVLTTAFDLALMMGCDPIVFAGADLAFTDGRPYARGTTYEEVWRRAEMWGQPIEECWSAAIAGWPDTWEASVTGEMVRTAPHLRSFRDWIAAEAAKTTGRTIINGTGGGILVGSAILQQSLFEALSSLPPPGVEVAERLAAARSATGARGMVTIGEPDEVTRAAWQAFAGSAVIPAPVTVVVPEVVEPEVAEPAVVFDCLPGGDLAADIEAAWQAVPQSVLRLVLRDRTGSPTGASVRRALFAFLEGHPEVSARFGRFFDPQDDRSWVDRRPVAQLFPGEDRDKWQDHHAEVANRLTPLIVERLKPASVLDMGCGAGHWVRAFAANGVVDVDGIEFNLDRFTPSREYDVSLCLGVAHLMPMVSAAAVIASCTEASDTVVFAVPAAAVGGAGFINQQPASVWARVFADRGFAAHDELRPLIEGRWGGYQNLYDLATVYRRVVRRGEVMPSAIRAAMIASASRVDELMLQVHLSVPIAAAGARARPRQDPPRMATAELEIPPARMEATELAGTRRFTLRTAAGALALAAGLESLNVAEDGHPAIFAAERDSVTFRSLDGTDPRGNGRRYTVTLPVHLAWLERLTLDEIIRQRI